ncbi:MAG: RluA family pseudouridine synthase [Pirellulales bacterium]|nr:RluA family pseudouridine synthase [Pirellulales bacterium]
MNQLAILYQDNHLLVVNKPAQLATMGAETEPTVHSLAADYLKHTFQKPGNAFVGIVSRLDAMTTGVLVLARTSKAASRLVPQFSGQGKPAAQKVYLAAVEDQLKSNGVLRDHVRKDDQARRMKVVAPEAEDAKLAHLKYLTIARLPQMSVVAVQLMSGRKHQIRTQFASRGHAVLGDRKYGAESRFAPGIALHSWRLRIVHPTQKIPMWFEADLPESWNRIVRQLPPPRELRDQVNRHFRLANDDAE